MNSVFSKVYMKLEILYKALLDLIYYKNVYYITELVRKELKKMNGILKVLPMLFTCLVSYIILMKIDKKYSLIIKIDSKLKIKKSYKPVFYSSSALILMLIFAGIGMYIVNLSETFFYILAGLILGAALNFIKIAEKN